jgi:Glyoxalase/Bleomycin resistance protein/Dioxygenase superfamily
MLHAHNVVEEFYYQHPKWGPFWDQEPSPKPFFATRFVHIWRKIMSGNEQGTIIRPTLHHVGVTTRHMKEMAEWYGKVLGMETVHASSHPLGHGAPITASACWVANE